MFRAAIVSLNDVIFIYYKTSDGAVPSELYVQSIVIPGTKESLPCSTTLLKISEQFLSPDQRCTSRITSEGIVEGILRRRFGNLISWLTAHLKEGCRVYTRGGNHGSEIAFCCSR